MNIKCILNIENKVMIKKMPKNVYGTGLSQR